MAEDRPLISTDRTGSRSDQDALSEAGLSSRDAAATPPTDSPSGAEGTVAAALPASGGVTSVLKTVGVVIGVMAAFAGGVAVSPFALKEAKSLIEVYNSYESSQANMRATTRTSTFTYTTITSTSTLGDTTTSTTRTMPHIGAEGFSCASTLELGPVKSGEKKGLALDDTTFKHCPHMVPNNWPNTAVKVASIRLFKAWDWRWKADRKKVWQDLRDYIWRNNVKVLFGTQIGCNETDDDHDWMYVKELMAYIGREHAMGLAIGNEIELIHTLPDVSQTCIDMLFSGGYFYKKTIDRSNDLATMPGFGDLLLTSVMGGYVMAGNPPFVNSKEAGVLSFIQAVTLRFGKRWAFTWNVYPYFDPHIVLDDNGEHTCTKAMMAAINFAYQSILPSQLAEYRRRMHMVTGRTDDIMWLGETGWSWPQAGTLNTVMNRCKGFSTEEAMALFYEGFLTWDLSISWDSASGAPVDHAFYFTMRDSVNVDERESFGLIRTCYSTECKLQEE